MTMQILRFPRPFPRAVPGRRAAPGRQSVGRRQRVADESPPAPATPTMRRPKKARKAAS
ncbi:hypothetical protein WJ968_23530 [Achromobacter xylosoxidans]